MNLSGKVVVVTGASRGIGLAFTRRFLEQGCQVLVVARSFPETYKEGFPEEQREKLVLLPCDLSQSTSRDKLISTLLAVFDVDIVVNNAGVLTGAMLQDLDPKDIETCFQVNLIATVLLTRALLPKMLKKKEGLIINNASVSAEFYFPGAQVYAASKAGVSLFTKSLAMELENTGVRTLLLLTPGVQTKMYEDVEKRYSSFMKLDFIDAISPEEWVSQVFSSIKKKHNICYPKGKNRMGLFVNRHFPALYEMGMRSMIKGKSPS